jgi:glycosyltransferase involved in cell wall biosynthesis
MTPLQPAARVPRDGPLRIGFVGTIAWHKGLHVLLAAARRLPAGAFELKIFGDPGVFPDYTAALRRQAEGLPVAWMEAFGAGQAARAYSQIDVLAVPSLWLENSPLVIHDALMARVPVVAARIGGIPELVAHEQSGLLHEAGAPDALAAALRRLIDDPALLARLGDGAGRSTAIKSMAQDARDWEAIYTRVVTGREATA